MVNESQELHVRATNSDYLGRRLQVNNTYSAQDFQEWILTHLDVTSSDNVLDVGCGNGAQSIAISRVIQNGFLTSVDLSSSSIACVANSVENPDRVRALVGDMDDLGDLLTGSHAFDLAFSVYAIYYARDPRRVLSTMLDSLRAGGRIAIACPMAPNGMVEIARRFHPIAREVDASLSFHQDVIEPFFRENFYQYSAHFLRNKQKIDSAGAFVEYYKSTTYQDESHISDIEQFANAEIERQGYIEFYKNTFMAIAQKTA